MNGQKVIKGRSGVLGLF